jgi:erythronate-4-phosphate dehydrogenase
MPHIVIDENVPLAREAFSGLGTTELVPGRNIDAKLLQYTDALIVRSVTQVTQELLQGSNIRWVGTCTIGIDHLDIPSLDSHGIAWSSAPGCNARSVAEHVFSSLCHLHLRRRLDLSHPQTLGIVGLGNTGNALATLARSIGWKILACDPPRVENGELTDSVTLEDCLRHSDIVSLHVPLTKGDIHPTHRLLSYRELGWLRPHATLINASRGPVIDPEALQDLLERHDDLSVALDVFDPEPAFPVDLARRVHLLSPHVAGYSLEGKIQGTVQIRNWLGRMWGLPEWIPPEPTTLEVDWQPVAGESAWDGLARLVLSVHSPARDDAAMSKLFRLDDAARAAGFDALRKEYPVRREWAHARCRQMPSPKILEMATSLGFRLDSPPS